MLWCNVQKTTMEGRPPRRLFLCPKEGSMPTPREIAQSWTRPYTSVQWAWVDALGIEPSDVWRASDPKRRRRDDSRDIREAMGQRYGVRGL